MRFLGEVSLGPSNVEEIFGAKVEFEEAKVLADLASIHQDLVFTRDALMRLIQLLTDGSQDHILIQSYWSAALVAYVRCFSTGKRYGLTPDIYKHLDGAIDCHNYYKDMRDKHIAHSVNPFEQVTVDVQLSPSDSDKKEVLGVAVLTMKFMVPEVNGVVDCLRLTSVALKHIVDRCKEYENKVLEVAKGMPIEQLYSKARGRLVAPGPDQAGKPRP